MKTFRLTAAAALAATAGLAIAQPTIDGTVSPAEESLYTINFIQDIPTGFGDAVAGQFRPGQPGGTVQLGDPDLVTTGIEIAIPLSALGGATSFDFFAAVNSGSREFLSNQTVHAGDQPQNMANIGGFGAFPFIPDYGVDVPGTQSISIAGLPVVADGSIAIDGTQDGSYAQVFVQNNYTQFGNSTCGDVAPGCGGSEIDNVAMAVDSNNLYIHIAGNLEGNGNGLDMWFDTGAGGQNALAGGATDSGNGIAFYVNNQAGTTFEPGFTANYGVSVDYSFGTLRALYADVDAGTVQLAGEAETADLTTGGAVTNEEIAGFLLTADNSNTAGVPGAEIGTELPDEPESPTSPDAAWAYGSEINNIRSYIDVPNNKLYLFVGGNLESAAANKFLFFWDTQPGGQNTLGINPDTLQPVDNPTISFEALLDGKLGGTVFDAGFNADFYNNFSFSLAGGNADPVNNFVDAVAVRTDGVLIDEFFQVFAEWAAFSGGAHPALMDFPGTYADPADGRTFLGTDGSPRLTTAAFGSPVGGAILAAANNSNTGGVTDTTADCAAAEAVNTGFEICYDLDELGWDGAQDILLFAALVNGDHNFFSSHVAGDTTDITGNLGGTPIDFTTLTGNQYLNLMTDTATCTVDPCDAIDFTGDGILDNGDIGAFVAAFLASDLSADINGDGILDNGDIGAFVTQFLACV
ncbi:MAG: GC-type dockerin domain-anchored protein [Phycisphaerales bacterium JB040]